MACRCSVAGTRGFGRTQEVRQVVLGLGDVTRVQAAQLEGGHDVMPLPHRRHCMHPTPLAMS